MKKPADAARDPAGEDVDRDGRARIEDVVNDVAHRGVQAAWRINRDENQRGAVTVGLVDAAIDVFGHDGLDFTVDVELDDLRRRECGRVRSRRVDRAGETDGEHDETSESGQATGSAHSAHLHARIPQDEPGRADTPVGVGGRTRPGRPDARSRDLGYTFRRPL